jgi:hypothetical protein
MALPGRLANLGQSLLDVGIRLGRCRDRRNRQRYRCRHDGRHRENQNHTLCQLLRSFLQES